MSLDKQADARWLDRLPQVIKKHITGRPHLQRVIGNTGWLIADNMLRMLIGLIVGIWVARYLGPASFGELNYALALVGMFSVVASLGIDGNIVRDLVREPERQSEILGTAFRLKFAGAFVSAIACVSAVSILRPEYPQTIWLVAILSAGMIFLTIETISLWFQAQVQSKYTVYAKNLAYVLGALIRVGLILNEAPLIAFAWAGLVESSLAALGLVLVYYRRLGRMPTAWTATWSRAKAMLREGWPLLLSSVSSMLYLRLDMIMLGEMSGDHSVGIYGAATRLSEVWYFLPMAIVSSLQPSLVHAREHSRQQYFERLSQLYRLMAALSIAVSLVVMFMAEPLIELLYGAQYKAAGAVLALHIWASVAVFLGVASSQYLLTENLQKLSFYRTTIGLGCNIILNFMLIPHLDALGAAIATLVSYCVATFSLILFPSARAQAQLMFQSLLPTQWLRLINSTYR
jgi:PST family polysaccharide transporter